MTQQYLGQIPDPAQESGTDLAARLNAFDNAHRTNQSGAARPAGILAGGLWTRVTAGVYEVMLFDGAQDHILMRGGSNLAGLTNLEQARLNLGLKALAIKDKAAIDADTTGTLPVNRGGTGGTTAAAARSGIGLTLPAGALNRLNESVNHVDSSWVAGVSELPGLPSPKQVRMAADTAVAAQALGVGQEWQDVTGSRVASSTPTKYQNTTGRTIAVSARIEATGTFGFRVSADEGPGLLITSGDGSAWLVHYFSVPPDHFYWCSISNTRPVIFWTELR